MDLLGKIKSVFERIDAETQAFAAKSGIRCRTDCGECCYTSLPEVRVVEMLPTAAQIFAEGKADEIFDAARANAKSVCVFYRANPQDPSLGRCGNYDLRPGLCRLFGFAAVRNKQGALDYAACHWHKRLQPETVEKVKREIAGQELAIPAFYAFDQEFFGLEPSPRLSERLPINQALVCALEHLALRQLGAREDRQSHVDSLH